MPMERRGVMCISSQSAQRCLELLEQTTFFEIFEQPRRVSTHDPDHLASCDDVITDEAALSAASQHLGFNLSSSDTDLTQHTLEGAKEQVRDLLFHHTCQLISNAHAITEIKRSKKVSRNACTPTRTTACVELFCSFTARQVFSGERRTGAHCHRHLPHCQPHEPRVRAEHQQQVLLASTSDCA